MRKIILLISSLTLFSVGISAQQITRLEKKAETPQNLLAKKIKTDEKPSADEIISVETELTEPKAVPSAEEQNAVDTSTAAQTTTYVRPTARQRFRRYASDAFGVPALIGSGIGATFNQISNDPPEWNRTVEGFGRRFASNYGEGAIRNTVSYGISEAFKLDNKFEKSGKKNFGSRIKHVFVASYTTRRKNGKRIPDFPQFIGTYTGSITAAEVWYPKRYSYKDGLREGTFSLGTRFGINLLREFLFPK